MTKNHNKHSNKTRKHERTKRRHEKRRHEKRRHERTRKHNETRRRHEKPRRRHNNILILPNRNPYYINEMSENIYDSLQDTKSVKPMNPINPINEVNLLKSYSPTVNKDLIKLQSIEREKVHDCNNEKAFDLKEPLEIGLPGKIYGKTCVPYYTPKAIQFLLKNLSANKHVTPNKIVPPVQSQSNCWFNTMFVTLFVSDKGRKFFHFFRQLMIEGIQANGESIPNNLRNGFALLNYAIDACLTGNKYAYILDTNAIIRNIYEAIPEAYKNKLPYIKDVDEAGNPMRYYGSLIQYLHNKSLQLLFIQNTNEKWKEQDVG